MRIDSITIESFGRFKNFHLDFEDGMNIIYGDNEAGKSTIMAFIEMMFYGRTAQEKSTDIGKSLRKKYAPWDGSAMCGELEFTYEGRQYRIHKLFRKTIKTDETILYDAQTGTEIKLGRDEEIGHRFFGVDVASFEKSVFISGFGGFAGTGQTSEDIAVRLSNMVTAMDEEVSGTEILARLAKGRENLRSRSGSKGILVSLEEEKNTITEELKSTEELIDRQIELLDRKKKLEEELKQCQTKREQLRIVAAVEELRNREKNSRQQLQEWNLLLEEGRRIEKSEAAFSGKNYSYNTAAEYVGRADELRSRLRGRQNAVDELAAKLREDSVPVNKDDIGRARSLEMRRNRLMLLQEQISSSYKQAFDDSLSAKEAEDRGRQVLEKIAPVSRSGLVAGFILCFAALLCCLMAVIRRAEWMPPAWVLISAAALLGLAGAVVIVLHVKRNLRQNREMEQAKQTFDLLTRERLVKDNRLAIEKERLFEKGAGLYPEPDCDFERITRDAFGSCCSELAAIYDSYNVQNEEELNRLADEAEEDRINRQMYENQLTELNRLRSEYEEYTKDADPEQVREGYAVIRQEWAVWKGKVSLKGMDDADFSKLEEKCRSLSGEAEALHDEYTAKYAKITTEECNEDTDSSDLQEQKESAMDERMLEKRIEDIREQLVELAALVKTPGHEPEKLRKRLAEISEELSEKEALYRAFMLAEDNMQAAVDEVGRSFGPVLNERTAKIFAGLTGGKYEKVMVDKEYAIQVKEPEGIYRDWRFLSNGTADQAYLALRLAMTELITEGGERLPIMLDDVLLQYDDKRAGYAMKCLTDYASATQLLYFTCRQPADGKVIQI